MARPLWQLLINHADFGRELSLSCDECFTIMDFFADQLVSGADPTSLRPSIKQHLSNCPDCRIKFNDWIEQLEKKAG